MRKDEGTETIEFDTLLDEVLREENAQTAVPEGLEQRLIARIAQEDQPAIWSKPPFAFAETIAAKRSPASFWTAIGLHAAVIGLIAILIAWRFTTGSISVTHIADRRNEIFYWSAITVSNTLGTALGDYTSDSLEMGFAGGAMLFGGLIALVAILYFTTKIPRAILFWAAFILTRPLGATLGDIVTKPFAQGGLNLDRIESSGALLLAMVACIALTNLRKPAPLGAAAH